MQTIDAKDLGRLLERALSRIEELNRDGMSIARATAESLSLLSPDERHDIGVAVSFILANDRYASLCAKKCEALN